MRPDRPSSTAQLVALGVVSVSRDPRLGYLVPPAADEASAAFLEACGGRAALLLKAAGHRWFRALTQALERATVPGMTLHYALRKRYLEDVVRQSLLEGFEQVVVLGAGFDTLALRLHAEESGALFVEVDHPATQRVKRETLVGQNLADQRLRLLPGDLEDQSLSDLLAGCKEYRPGSSTLLIAEGVLMYLNREAVEAVFDSIAALPGRARIAFTYMEPSSHGHVRFHNSTRLADWWLERKGERFRWGVPRERIEEEMTAHGLRVLELAGSKTLRRHFLTGQDAATIPLAEGEFICVAERV